MNLDVICDILVEADLGVLGETLFQDHMPDDVTEGIMFRLPIDGIPIDSYLPEYFRAGKLQVIARSPSHDAGKALANGVMNALTIMQRTSFFDADDALVMRINNMRPCTLPIVYPRTPGNLTEWSINFDANYFMPRSITDA